MSPDPRYCGKICAWLGGYDLGCLSWPGCHPAGESVSGYRWGDGGEYFMTQDATSQSLGSRELDRERLQTLLRNAFGQ